MKLQTPQLKLRQFLHLRVESRACDIKPLRGLIGSSYGKQELQTMQLTFTPRLLPLQDLRYAELNTYSFLLIFSLINKIFNYSHYFH